MSKRDATLVATFGMLLCLPLLVDLVIAFTAGMNAFAVAFSFHSTHVWKLLLAIAGMFAISRAIS